MFHAIVGAGRNYEIKVTLLALLILVYGLDPLYSQSTDSISGIVVTVDGIPMVGVPVRAKAEGTIETGLSTIVTQTDNSGQYRFENIPSGIYVLSAGPDGGSAISLRALFVTSISLFDDILRLNRITGTQDLTASRSLTTSVLMGAARVTVPDPANAGVNIAVLTSSVMVRGHVAFAPGHSPPPFRVNLTGTGSRLIAGADVGTDGSFEFPHVAPGTYVLRLIPNLGVPPQELTVSDQDLIGIELGGRAAGVRVSGNVLRSDRPGYQDMFPQWVYLVGRDTVDESANRFIPPFRITAFVPGSEPAKLLQLPQTFSADSTGPEFEPPYAPVGPDGRFEFLAVPPATYYLRTFPDMGLANTAITVAEGMEIDNVRAGVGVRVRGEVVPTNLGTRPPELINLTATGPGGPSVSAMVNADGSFEFPKVGPGTYRIVLDRTVRPTPSEVTIGDEDSVFRVEAPFKSGVSGRVNFVGPSPPPESLPAIHVGLSSGYESAINPDGSFKLASNEGEFEFFVTNLPEGYVVKSMFYGTDNLLNEPVKVDLSAAAREILVTLQYNPGASP